MGVYFVSQNPLDIPDNVLGQLGNRVQHALRAFTPRDQKAVTAAAQTFRQNPKLNVKTVLTELVVGEALVSMLDENGAPQIVERAKIVPPRSQIGAITPEQRAQIIQSSVLAGHYEKAVDRESAFEKLQQRAQQKRRECQRAAGGSGRFGAGARQSLRSFPRSSARQKQFSSRRSGPRGGRHDSMATSMVKSAVRAAGSQVGRQLVRGVLGGLLGGSSGRR